MQEQRQKGQEAQQLETERLEEEHKHEEEVLDSLNDFKGVFAALFAIQSQLSSASLDPDLLSNDLVDLAPFVLFLGIS